MNYSKSGLKDKTVLITGGSGSLGQALARKFLEYNPSTIRIFSNDENGLVEMRRKLGNERLRYLHGDIRERGRLRRALDGVDIVIHAAALKHVDVCEYNPIECVKTNVDGTINVIDTALDCAVGKAIFVSSDKAVHPINTYGASKLLGEKLWIDSNNYRNNRFSVIRLGNIWESRANAIQLWQKQKELGEEIAITDKDMSRFYIHEDEATAFVIRCIELMEGGEIFIPKMRSYTLEELVSRIAPECTVRIIGRRRGEKKKEILMNEDEKRHLTTLQDMLIIRV
jgi:FlaA1/EpsC-like NDP-sugar epimerase